MAGVIERTPGRFTLLVKDASGRWIRVPSKAPNKTAARKLAAELEQQYERQRLGLEPLPTADGGGTVAALMEWWHTTYVKGQPSYAVAAPTVRKHIIESPIAGRTLATLTAGDIEALIQSKADSLAPGSLNHLRSFLLVAFNRAREAGRWVGPNPAASVRRRKVPRRTPAFLTPEEVPDVLTMVPSRWRPLFAAAVYTGLRKGELLGLRKPDVDLKAQRLTVARSYDQGTTKGGHADVIPIAAELVPYLTTAIAASPSDLVFSEADGKMLSPRTPLENVLRRAMAQAGIVTGYRHVCRKRGCSYFEDAPDAALRRCPKHGEAVRPKLWAKAKVRPIRFHDLRHTTASLLMMAGANPAAVQRIMRHSDPRITTEVYGHLAPGYLQAEVDRLRFGAPPAEAIPTPIEARMVANSPRLVPRAGKDDDDPEVTFRKVAEIA